MEFWNNFFLYGILTLHIFIAGSLSVLIWRLWCRLKSGRNGDSRAVLAMAGAFLFTWLWSIAVTVALLIGVATSAPLLRGWRFLSLAAIVYSIINFIHHIMTEPDPDAEEAVADDE